MSDKDTQRFVFHTSFKARITENDRKLFTINRKKRRDLE